MDIEFIEEEHRQDVMKLMEICGIDMSQAYQLYCDSGYNFEGAVQKNFNLMGGQNSDISESSVNVNPNQGFEEQYYPQYQDQYMDVDEEYQNYKNFISSGNHFAKRYDIRRHQTFFSSIIPRFIKGDPENEFKTSLEKYIERRIKVNFNIGNLSQAFQDISKTKFPLAIAVLNFDQSSKIKIRQVFSDEILVESLNVQFKSYGLNTKTYDLEACLKPFVNLQNDRNCLIICRIDITDEIKVMTKINLITTDLADIKKQIKQVKSQAIQKELDEMHLEKQYNEERRGNFDYQRPKSIKENIKAREDKKLRRHQEEEYQKALLSTKPNPNQKKQQKKTEITKASYNQSIKPIEKQSSAAKKQESAQQIASKRVALRANLKLYDSGMNIKLRVPSGESIKFFVNSNEKVQYLFDYVNSENADLGFENDKKRHFDIIRPYDKYSLNDKKDQKLSIAFEESEGEALVVNQILE